MKLNRLRIIIASGLVLVVAAFACLYFWFSVPVGSGPAGPIVSGETFAQQWTIDLSYSLDFGDSVTAGFGARKGYSYFDRLVQNPMDESQEMKGICFGTSSSQICVYQFVNSGSTSIELLEQELPHLAQADSNTLGIVVSLPAEMI